MKYSLALLFSLIFATTIAQESFFAVSHSQTHGYDIRETFSSVNKVEDQFVIYILDFEYIYAHGFDQDLQTLGRLRSPFSIRKYPNTLVQSSFGQTHTIIVANSNLNKIAYAEFDFAKHLVNSGDIEIDMSGQEFLRSYSYDNKPLILTINKKEPTLHVYTIEQDYSVSKKDFDLSGYEFYNYKGRVVDPDQIFNRDNDGMVGIGLDQKSDFPVSLGETGSRSKMYAQGSMVLITLDYWVEQTQILTLDLESATTSLENIEKPKAHKQRFDTRNNSFLYNDQLAQIKYWKDSIHLSVTNINTKEVLQKFVVTKESGSSYINGDIVQTNSDKLKRKTIEGDVFFRKLRNNENLCVLLNEIDGKRELSYGVYLKSTSGGSSGYGIGIGFGVMGGALGGAFGYGLTVMLNPNIASFSTIVNGQAAEALSIFDADYNHLQEASKSKTIYDDIEEYRKENKKGSPVVLFKFKDDIIFGAYFSKGNFIDLFKY